MNIDPMVSFMFQPDSRTRLLPFLNKNVVVRRPAATIALHLNQQTRTATTSRGIQKNEWANNFEKSIRAWMEDCILLIMIKTKRLQERYKDDRDTSTQTLTSRKRKTKFSLRVFFGVSATRSIITCQPIGLLPDPHQHRHPSLVRHWLEKGQCDDVCLLAIYLMNRQPAVLWMPINEKTDGI